LCPRRAPPGGASIWTGPRPHLRSAAAPLDEVLVDDVDHVGVEAGAPQELQEVAEVVRDAEDFAVYANAPAASARRWRVDDHSVLHAVRIAWVR
jgi:hypothetical protein